ncbi:MAG: monovalent cation/H(+) antiporter subunit G [Bacillota bacterium]
MAIRLAISYILMGAGGVFAIITVIGLLRFPDAFTRIHAGAVVLTISAVLVTLGIAVYVWEPLISLKIILIAFFFLISNPMATHAIARASYRKKIVKLEEKSIDEYSEYIKEQVK